MGRRCSLAFDFVWLLFATLAAGSAALANVVRVETAVDGNKLNLTEIEVTNGVGTGAPHRVVPWSLLLPATVVDYLSVPENNAANTITVLGTSDDTAPTGHDRLGLLGDPHLNTGVFNPSSVATGVHVSFARPLVNGPSEDFVIFELTIGTGQTPDPMVIRQLDGVGTARSVLSSHYQLQGVIPAVATPNTFLSTTEIGGSTDFAELMTTPLSNNGPPTNPKWHVIPVDLSWLGVPDWQTVETLEILSGDVTRGVDLLMVAGLPPAYYPGDFDNDLDADGADFLVWQRQAGAIENLTADANDDGMVDGADLTIWQDYFGSGQKPGVGSVPEAGVGTLAAAAICCAAAARRRMIRRTGQQ